MKSTFRHVGIVVNDIDVCLKFWLENFELDIHLDNLEITPFVDELLGLETAGLRTVKLSDQGGFILELLHFTNKNVHKEWVGDLATTGLTHIALNVLDLEKKVDLLVKKGYETLSSIKKSPDNKVKVVFVKGPENIMLELVQVI